MNVTYDRSPINLVPTDEPLRKPNSIQLLSNQTASYENTYNEDSKEKQEGNVYNFSNILDKIKIFNFMRSSISQMGQVTVESTVHIAMIGVVLHT